MNIIKATIYIALAVMTSFAKPAFGSEVTDNWTTCMGCSSEQIISVAQNSQIEGRHRFITSSNFNLRVVRVSYNRLTSQGLPVAHEVAPLASEIEAGAELEAALLTRRQKLEMLMNDGDLSEEIMREVSGGKSYAVPGSAHDVAGSDSMKDVLEASLRAYYTENLGLFDSSYFLYWTNQGIGMIPLLGDFLDGVISGTINFEFDDGTLYTLVLVGVSVNADFELVSTWEVVEGTGVDGEYPIPEGGAYHTISPTRDMVDSGYYDRAVSAPHSGLQSWLDGADELKVCTGIKEETKVCYTIYVYR